MKGILYFFALAATIDVICKIYISMNYSVQCLLHNYVLIIFLANGIWWIFKEFANAVIVRCVDNLNAWLRRSNWTEIFEHMFSITQSHLFCSYSSSTKLSYCHYDQFSKSCISVAVASTRILVILNVNKISILRLPSTCRLMAIVR